MTQLAENSARPLAITATGMVTGVGLDTFSSCAAIRAAIDNFQETRFMDAGGEWILGCEAPLEQPWRGTRKLAKMLAMALKECAQQAGADLAQVPVMLCLAEPERPGRASGFVNRVFFETQEELGFTLHQDIKIIEHGRVGGLVAMRHARTLIYENKAAQVIIAGVDSLLNAASLKVYEQQTRLLTSKNSDGFIPGEAAAAIMVSRPRPSENKQLICRGVGFGIEEATINSEKPLRAEGLVKAIKESLHEAEFKMEEVDFRIADVSGEHYWFKESSLALLRTLHTPKEEFDIWHPADCIGEVGAAICPAILAVLKTACEKGYSKGSSILCHFSNIDSKRGAGVFTYGLVGAA